MIIHGDSSGGNGSDKVTVEATFGFIVFIIRTQLKRQLIIKSFTPGG